MQRATLLLALVVGQGCDPPAPQDEAPAAKPTAEQIFRFLTANTWRNIPPGARQKPGPDYTVTQFAPDGTWSVQHVTDHHIDPKTGKWNLQQDAAGHWFVCRDDGQRHQVIMNADGTLTLTAMRLYPDQPLRADPRLTATDLPEIALPAEVEQSVRQLTAQRWKRANDLDLRMDPTEIRFERDWTYVATYRHGECTSAGHWYATTKGIHAINLAGRCDDRPGTGGDQLTAVVIDDSQILVNGDLYVPEGTHFGRGTIWRLFSFDTVAIRIDYDMPMRAGEPVRFDVTMTNTSDRPVKLERFSLTGEYDNYGRNVSDTGKSLVLPEELSGVDLQGVELAPGQSHETVLEATFANAGQRWVYFNALISGVTQNWDVHQAHEASIKN